MPTGNRSKVRNEALTKALIHAPITALNHGTDRKTMMSQAAARQPINVMIVEDDNVTRKYLAAAIQSEPRLQLVAAFDSVQPALASLVSTPVDLLLTDLGLPDGSGVDVIRACVDRWPDCGILVITMSSDEDSVLACIEAGAAGYVLKDAGRLDIVRALLDLHSGGSPISPLIARKVLGRMRDAMPSSSAPPSNAPSRKSVV